MRRASILYAYYPEVDSNLELVYHAEGRELSQIFFARNLTSGIRVNQQQDQY